MRLRTAAMKPKAAAMQPSAAGMTSCRAPQARPPSGKWESMAAKPKGRGLRCSPIGGRSRRSSAITVARLRAKAAVGAGFGCAKPIVWKLLLWKLLGYSLGYSLYVLAEDYRTKQEQCQGRNCFDNYYPERSRPWAADGKAAASALVRGQKKAPTEERMSRGRCLSVAAR